MHSMVTSSRIVRPPRESVVTASDMNDEEMAEDELESDFASGCYSSSCCRRHHHSVGNRTKNCSVVFTRFCLIIPNAMFLVAGLSLIGFGVWIRMDREAVVHLELMNQLPNMGPLIALDLFPIVVIFVGCCVAILSLMGCCGAWAENASCLCFYTCCLLLVLCAEIVIVIIGFIIHEQMVTYFGNSMKHEITLTYNSSFLNAQSEGDKTFSNYFSKSWDTIQNKFNCCGSFGPEDYEFSAWFNRTRDLDKDTFVPVTCCYIANIESGSQSIRMKSTVFKECQKDAALYINHRSIWDSMTMERKSALLKTKGCHKLIFHATDRTLSIAVGFACAVVMLQILSFVFGCILLRHFRQKQDEIWINLNERIT